MTGRHPALIRGLGRHAGRVRDQSIACQGDTKIEFMSDARTADLKHGLAAARLQSPAAGVSDRHTHDALRRLILAVHRAVIRSEVPRFSCNIIAPKGLLS